MRSRYSLADCAYMCRPRATHARSCAYMLVLTGCPCTDKSVLAAQSKVAAIAMATAPTPRVLLDMAQLLYQLSKHADNDHCFLELPLVPRMLHAIAKAAHARDSSPAVLLLVATLRNASANESVRDIIAEQDGISVFVRLLRSNIGASRSCSQDNSSDHSSRSAQGGADTATASSRHASLAVQALGVLRNLAASQALLPAMAAGRASAALCAALKAHADDTAVLLAGARLLAKLTLHAGCSQAVMADRELLRAVAVAAVRSVGNSDAALRYAFALSNLAARTDDAATLGSVCKP